MVGAQCPGQETRQEFELEDARNRFQPLKALSRGSRGVLNFRKRRDIEKDLKTPATLAIG